jgi:ketosteroid isomerase-like protein
LEEDTMSLAKQTAIMVLAVFLHATATFAQSKAAQDVTALLQEFMQAAGRGDRAVFDKFFADDVIYTRATGVVISKSDIMNSLQKPPADSEGKATYSAEDITLHEYGETVVVVFRLEARTERSAGSVELAHYRNTGTFVRRNGRWQVVAWQATKIAETAKP